LYLLQIENNVKVIFVVKNNDVNE